MAEALFEFKKIKMFFDIKQTRAKIIWLQNFFFKWAKSKKKTLEVVDAQVSVTTMHQIVKIVRFLQRSFCKQSWQKCTSIHARKFFLRYQKLICSKIVLFEKAEFYQFFLSIKIFVNDNNNCDNACLQICLEG